MIAFAVPDCTESVERGDLSMVIHEHMNYFEMASLRRLVESADFKVERIERASMAASFFARRVVAGKPEGCRSP